MSKEIPTGTIHKLPEDLRKSLLSFPAARAAWGDITPLARNEWICWIESVKTKEIRRQHVERTITDLKEGKRRPCCWMGCVHRTDKAMSPSQNFLLNKKSKKN